MTPTKRSRVIIFSSVVITFVALACNDTGGWFRSTFIDSKVHDAKPVPAFSRAGRQPGIPSLGFIAVGDAGTGGHGQRLVAESMAQKASTDSTSFVLLLGDNIYESGVSSVKDPQWPEKFETVYDFPSLQIPFIAVLGNHDYYLNPQAQVEYTEVSDRWYMPSRYYTTSFRIDDSAEVQLFCLDTKPLAYGKKQADRQLESESQIQWLEVELSASKARWRIVAGHHTIYSNGEHGDNPHLASILEPLFVRHNVDMYLAGHDHDLQILQPVKGVHYIVSGGGGKHRNTRWRENTIFAATNLGFTWISISFDDALVQFFDAAGTLQYAHVIGKREAGTPEAETH